MSYPTTAAAILALRSLIHDGPTDKLAFNKKVYGVINGTNTLFKTFETRRVGAFNGGSPVSYPQGVYNKGSQIAPSGITTDDPVSGAFTLQTAPATNDTTQDAITATYYYQWFLDSDLDGFLQNASNWLGYGATYVNVPDGLNMALLRFAAQEAYAAAAMKYTTRMSEVFKTEDAPDETILKSISAFQSMSKDMLENATTFRDDFYTRQGQSKAPVYNLSTGCVRDPVPRR